MSEKTLQKIILLGDAGVGKTCLMNQFTAKRYSNQYRATIGADFVSKEVLVQGTPVSLQLWDTAGQERFQSLGVTFYRGAHACILVFDITDGKSFDKLINWHREFLVQAGPTDVDNFPFVVVANKCDLANDSVILEEEVRAWCHKSNINVENYIEVSAKLNINVTEAFMKASELALANHTDDTTDLWAISNTTETSLPPADDENPCAC
ncbi:hypothetical protein PCE1_000633 [Barthelona sp. PCE]